LKIILSGTAHEMPELEMRFLRLAHPYTKGRCLFKSKEGYFGLALSTAQEGDKVCALLGCTSPLILRPKIGGLREKQSRIMVGECYVPGMVSSEAGFGPLEDG
jgi:hypothetical protein